MVEVVCLMKIAGTVEGERNGGGVRKVLVPVVGQVKNGNVVVVIDIEIIQALSPKSNGFCEEVREWAWWQSQKDVECKGEQ